MGIQDAFPRPTRSPHLPSSSTWRKQDTTFLLQGLFLTAGLGAFLEELTTPMLKGTGLGRKDKEVRESKGTQRGRFCPQQGRAWGNLSFPSFHFLTFRSEHVRG